MNLSTLRTQISSFVGDPDQTRYTAQMYLDAANRAQEQFALDTKSLWKDTTWTTVSGTATYDLPSNFMWEQFVTYDSKPLNPITRLDAVRLYGSDWATATGAPGAFIIDPEEAQKKILLVPIPQEAKTLGMRYFPLPTALSSDSDIPLNSSALMAQFHIGLAAYAAWLLLMSEKEPGNAIVQKMRQLERIYADSVTKATDTFKNTASRGLRITGGAVWS